jgi:hypothetical protein
VSREWPVTTPTITIASAFGGSVFITLPRKLEKEASVTIAGAVAAPLFVRGTHNNAAWQSARQAPGPWAELVGKRVALSVPSYAVRKLEDAESLMVYWDEVLDHAADLYAIPRERVKPERYCADIQISAGYMHSGYPIMTFDDVAYTYTDISILRGTDGDKTWGFYHELGHNHQQSDWTWEGCGEVTNNLFSLYGGEMLNGVGVNCENTHPAMHPKEREPRRQKYVAAGAPYEKWQSDPFLALTLFWELRRDYGWEPFKRVFATYGNNTLKTEQEKRDQFMVRFSKEVKKDLSPFFTAWGIPTSPEAKSLARRV